MGNFLEGVFYQEVCWDPNDGNAITNNAVRCFSESKWLSQVVHRWKTAVGWQRYQQQVGGAKRFKHYKLFFDDAAVVQVIAANLEIGISETAGV